MSKKMNIWEFVERNKPFVKGVSRDLTRLVIVGGIFLMTSNRFDADEIVNLLLIAAGLLGVRGVEVYRSGSKT